MHALDPRRRGPIEPGIDPRSGVLLGLIYLGFVFLPLVFWPKAGLRELLYSLAAIALFLPMWFGFTGTGRWRSDPRLLLATAALGYALIPINPGGNTFVIYAMTMAAHSWRPRAAVFAAIVLWALMAVEFFVLIPDWRYAAGVSMAMALVGGMACFGILASRARERQQAALQLSQDEVRRLAALAERERIGRDLHDVLGHTLSLVVLKTQLARRLLSRDSQAAEAELAELESAARGALDQVREAVSGIRASGLAAELAAARLALLSADVKLEVRRPALDLPPAVDAEFALAVREAVTNVIRHARAGQVEIELEARGQPEAGQWVLSIRDDGRGGAAARSGHTGLEALNERARALGGRCEIDSPAGGGTRIILSADRSLPQPRGATA
jgi:two-component system, NarL family, sensor histidine kinase DesK